MRDKYRKGQKVNTETKSKTIHSVEYEDYGNYGKVYRMVGGGGMVGGDLYSESYLDMYNKQPKNVIGGEVI